MSQKTRPKPRLTFKEAFLGFISFVFGVAVMTVSIMLLFQSTSNHKDEKGEHFEKILSEPFKNSNWMKSSIPIIVVSSFGIVLGSIQVISASIFLLTNTKWRILALIIWIGAHIMVFVFNIICFSLAITVKAHERKDSGLFWQNYQFQSIMIPNPEGHAYCSLLAGNSIFILISISLTAPKLYQYDAPITLPAGSY